VQSSACDDEEASEEAANEVLEEIERVEGELRDVEERTEACALTHLSCLSLAQLMLEHAPRQLKTETRGFIADDVVIPAAMMACNDAVRDVGVKTLGMLAVTDLALARNYVSIYGSTSSASSSACALASPPPPHDSFVRPTSFPSWAWS
jgi:hypothetical protein